jgi:hypothetical protein
MPEAMAVVLKSWKDFSAYWLSLTDEMDVNASAHARCAMFSAACSSLSRPS